MRKNELEIDIKLANYFDNMTGFDYFLECFHEHGKDWDNETFTTMFGGPDDVSVRFLDPRCVLGSFFLTGLKRLTRLVQTPWYWLKSFAKEDEKIIPSVLMKTLSMPFLMAMDGVFAVVCFTTTVVGIGICTVVATCAGVVYLLGKSGEFVLSNLCKAVQSARSDHSPISEQKDNISS